MNTFSSLHARLTLHPSLRLNERQAFAGLTIRKDSRPREDAQRLCTYALKARALSSLNASPGARASYDQQRAKGIERNDALRRLANRLVGILHGCLKTRTLYDEATAWGHWENLPQSSVAA